MNITKSLLTLAFAGVLFTGCKDTAKEPEASDETATKSEVAQGKTETASFNIEGMTCAMGCAKTIEGKLSGLEGVTKATVDFEHKTAKVEYDSAKQSPEKIAETVEAVADGKTYKVSNVKSSADQAMVINKDKKKKSKDKKAEDKKGCATDAKEGKSGCCASKKSCSSGEKAAM
jgi:mercuric ion binding protein